MNKAKKLFLAASVGLSLLVVASCGKKDATELVRQRATERWDLLGGKHIVKAYDYLSPGYRSTHTLEQYVAFVATARMQWKSAKVDSLLCEEEVCTVKLTVVSVLPGAILQRPSDMEYPAPVVEKWVLSEGQWYFLPESKIPAKSIAERSDAKVAPESSPPARLEGSQAAPPAAAKDAHDK